MIIIATSIIKKKLRKLRDLIMGDHYKAGPAEAREVSFSRLLRKSHLSPEVKDKSEVTG